MARSLAIPALVAALLLAGAARAGDDCFAPMSDWQPRAAVAELAASRGWQVRRIRVDDGCYQVLGQDAGGRPLEVTLNPSTLEVVEIEYGDVGKDGGHDDDDDGHGGGHGPEPAPPPDGRRPPG